LKIAYIVHDYHRRGGHSRYVAELVDRFKQEHSIHVFANQIEEPHPEGITFHSIPAIRSSALSTILSFFLPAVFLVRGRFDIIHSQGFCGWHQDITTCHFIQDAWFDRLRVAQGGHLNWRQKLFRYLVSFLERTAFRSQTKRVIAISKRIQEDLKTYFHRSKGVDVIYHGVDLETFHPRQRDPWRQLVRKQLGVDDGACLVLFVGNPDKGAEPALRAMARIPNIPFAIVSGARYDRYRQIAQELGITDRVHFCPATNQVEKYFAAADIFLFPTVYDPFGMVITEAMAAGLPVVTSLAAGAAELIDPGIDGLLTKDAWDVDQITSEVQKLVDAPGYRMQMGNAARKKIEAYTWDSVAEQTMAIYREIVDNHR
jgi:UDP-glucose:(heptosyl)LPS alpha-1,3-glucosyltransferase